MIGNSNPVVPTALPPVPSDAHSSQVGKLSSKNVSRFPIGKIVKDVAKVALAVIAAWAAILSVPLTGGFSAALIIGGSAATALFLEHMASKYRSKT